MKKQKKIPNPRVKKSINIDEESPQQSLCFKKLKIVLTPFDLNESKVKQLANDEDSSFKQNNKVKDNDDNNLNESYERSSVSDDQYSSDEEKSTGDEKDMDDYDVSDKVSSELNSILDSFGNKTIDQMRDQSFVGPKCSLSPIQQRSIQSADSSFADNSIDPLSDSPMSRPNTSKVIDANTSNEIIPETSFNSEDDSRDINFSASVIHNETSSDAQSEKTEDISFGVSISDRSIITKPLDLNDSTLPSDNVPDSRNTTQSNIEHETSNGSVSRALSSSRPKVKHSVKRRRIKNHSSDDSEDDLIPKMDKRMKIKYPKTRWTESEVQAIKTAFPESFQGNFELPSTEYIMKQKKIHPQLQRRTHLQIKSYITNCKNKNQRKPVEGLAIRETLCNVDFLRRYRKK
ncbi:hypothetical protein HCN44_000812 [Aphidius gifuensis]|uniref:Uncharacterized protein n=1 Tax=Aphidius gifuensis TaxID=684658 RepID=A0A835CP77_APHGI|nr:hypothetical protein HCN44_000812 [Aphidius gifuensis]